MEKHIPLNRNCIAAFILLLSFISCNTKKYTPFPDDTPGDVQPISKTLVLGEQQPLHWKEISPDSIKPSPTVSLDINQLPVIPFTVNDFRTFKNPMQSTKLDWDNIPDSIVNFDTIPARSFKLQQSILPKPATIKAGMPKLLSNTTSGILQFSEEEGLPGTAINASLVDDQGMLWLATNKGLCRYTGELLQVYSITNKAPQGSDYTITSMTKDSSGRIWITTAGDGIYIIDISKGLLLHDNSQKVAIDITNSYDGNMWVAGFENNLAALYIINAEKQTVKTIPSTNYCLQIKEDKNHYIWMGNNNHISIISPDRKKIKRLAQKEGLDFKIAFKLFEDSKGDMWIGSFTRGINIVSLKNKTISTINADNGFTGIGVEFAEDRKGKVWVIQKDTICVFNKERTAFKTMSANFLMTQQLKGTSIIDAHGNIWIGSLDKGALIIDPEGPLPEHLSTKNGLSDNNVWGIMEAKDGNIWIGTYNGINIYNPVKNETRLLSNEKGAGSNRASRMMEYNEDTVIAITQTGFRLIDRRLNTISSYSSNYLNNRNILNCTKDKQNRLWLGGANGLLQLDLHNHSGKQFNRSSGLPSNLIWAVTTDSSGNIWAGTDSGVAIINPANNTIKYLRKSEGLCNNAVMKIVAGKNEDVWVATQKGISIINLKKNTITNLTAKEGLVPDAIYDLLEGSDGMFAGSADGMIFITGTDSTAGKKRKWHFINYGKKEGFPFNDYNQNAGAATKSGQLWWGITPVLTVVTQPVVKDSSVPVVNISGVSIMDVTPSFFSYKELGRQIKTGDTLWDETKTKSYLQHSLPKDSGYTLNNDIRWDSTTALFKLPVGLSLPYNQNSVSFWFVNNDIKGRDKIVYSYILEGAEKSWSEVNDIPGSKNYFNLAPGSYTFRVCSRGFNGIWSNPAEISFTIRPPWWQTWWAYLLYVTALGSFAWSFAYYRSIKLKKENRVLEDKVSFRTEQLKQSIEELKSTQSQLIQSEKMASLGELTAGIAHEIQNPLNFVNNFSELNKELLEEMNDAITKGDYEEVKALAADISGNQEKINFHGKRADGIVKGMLQHSRSSSGQKEPTDINALADEYLRLSYHGLRAKDKTFNAKYEISLDENIGKIKLVPQDIGRVILNLLNNAFYAVNEKKKLNPTQPYDPTVTISTQKHDKTIEIKIADNGNGIPDTLKEKIFQPFFTTKPTGQGTGLGLSLSYDIVTKGHAGELKLETTAGQGSAFTIVLPSQ